MLREHEHTRWWRARSQDATNVALVLTLCPGGDLAYMIKSRYPSDKKGNKTGPYEKLQPVRQHRLCGTRCILRAHARRPHAPSLSAQGHMKFYAASMALGLAAIHEQGYVYRDLKPQNVLLDGDGFVRISDMGLAHDIGPPSDRKPIKQRSGTRGYWSPEVINGEKYTVEPDWFSLGVTMFVLFSDKMPFHGKTPEETDEQTQTKEVAFKHDEPPDLQKIISQLCEKKVEGRLGCGGGGIEEIKKHEYFSGFDWQVLEAGNMKAPFVPNPDDINAPSAKARACCPTACVLASCAQLSARPHLRTWRALSRPRRSSGRTRTRPNSPSGSTSTRSSTARRPPRRWSSGRSSPAASRPAAAAAAPFCELGARAQLAVAARCCSPPTHLQLGWRWVRGPT